MLREPWSAFSDKMTLILVSAATVAPEESSLVSRLPTVHTNFIAVVELFNLNISFS